MWKKLALVIIVLMLVAGCSKAAEAAEETSRGIYTTPCPWATQWLNENKSIHHKHLYKDNDTQRAALEGGVGLDLILFVFGEDAKNLKKVKLELKKDFVDMDRASAYLVAEIDVSSVFDFLKK